MAPESDEEKTEEAKKEEPKPDGATAAKPADDKDKEKDKEKEKAKQPPVVKIDFDNIGQRIVALPIPERNYAGLAAGKSGELILLEAPPLDDHPLTVQKFDLKKRKLEKLVDEVTGFALSANGEKMLLRQGDTWRIAPVEPLKPDNAPLKLAAMEVWVDPRAEWKQMYHEVWRIQRDFLYDSKAHGLDLAAAERFYGSFVEGLGSRGDLNYLFTEMLGNLTLGHVFVNGGARPQPAKVTVGAAGRGLRDRKRPLPFRQDLQRRKLESRSARALDATGRQCEKRRLSAGGERARGPGVGRRLPILPGDRR